METVKARELRRNATVTERRLWHFIRNRQLLGYKFRRQVPIDSYIVDFACFERRVIIELDGAQHMDSNYDAHRDAYLREEGFQVLRFWNNAVWENLDGVLSEIRRALG